MTLPKLVLAAPGGGHLSLYGVQLDSVSDYLSAEAYIAQHNYREGTVFKIVEGAKPLPIQTQQHLVAGMHLYPGDEQHFGRLSELPLFLLVQEG